LEEQRKKRKKKVVFPKDVKIGFENVGGYEKEKKAIKDLCNRIKKGGNVKGGMILYGPPGTGKTMLAKIFAKEVGYPFFFKNGAELQSGTVAAVATNSEQSKLFDLFEEVEDYRSEKNINKIILFIDELDAMGSNFISSAKNQISQTSKG
jgi:SpoVK/Ycf46/Vps4 family AAA+-type ATPase